VEPAAAKAMSEEITMVVSLARAALSPDCVDTVALTEGAGVGVQMESSVSEQLEIDELHARAPQHENCPEEHEEHAAESLKTAG